MGERESLASDFIRSAGWGNAQRRFLAGDASDRRYQRLFQDGETAILMDAPPGRGDDPKDFVKITHHLLSIGLSSPRIYAQDLVNGFLLIEDLGDDLFARLLEQDGRQELELYLRATDVLLHLQDHPAPPDLPNLTRQDWANSAAIALDHYAAPILPVSEQTRADFVGCLAAAFAQSADGSRVLILRDYHAENLLFIPQRKGVASIGLLDFQLAQLGQPLYDLVSLLQDARRDVSPEVVTACLNHFAQRKGVNRSELDAPFAVLGALRALRILGVFARLCSVAGKPGYLALMPRVWQHLMSNLEQPELSELRKLCRDTLPKPTETVLQTIRNTCATTCP